MRVGVFLGFLFFIDIFFIPNVVSQDIQHSQYYAAPLLMNPAFAGISPNTKVSLNYRNQWPNSGSNYSSTSFLADNYFPYAKSGVGIQFTQLNGSLGSLSATSFGAAYSYLFNAVKSINIKLGINSSYTIRSIDTSKLIFGDQIQNDGSIAGTSENLNVSTNNYIDVGAGALIHNTKGWIGFSVLHLLEPSLSFVQGDNSVLNRRMSVHLGWKFRLDRVYTKQQRPRLKERSVTPSLQYKIQGNFTQIDVGTTLTLEPIVFGVSYRGIPTSNSKVTELSDVSRNESLIFLLGLSMLKPNLLVGYSYDYPLSVLGLDSGGTHEITISYIFWDYKKKMPPRDVQLIPCPKF